MHTKLRQLSIFITIAIFTPLITMSYQDVFANWLSDRAGDVSESVTGSRSTHDLEQSKAGEMAGDLAENTIGVRSTADIDVPFSVPVPFTIPSTPIAGTIQLVGTLRNIADTDVQLTLLGFNMDDVKLGSDNTVTTHSEATIENMIRDLSGGTVTNIDDGKELISKAFGIEVGPLAKLTMDLSINLPFPNSLSDISQIKDIVPIPSIVIAGCYNKIGNNLPDFDNTEEMGGVIVDHDKAVTQEDVCTNLLDSKNI
jgi:hypothetical protein